MNNDYPNNIFSSSFTMDSCTPLGVRAPRIGKRCFTHSKSRRGLVVTVSDLHARGRGFEAASTHNKRDSRWGKVAGAHPHKCVHSPGDYPLWLGSKLRTYCVSHKTNKTLLLLYSVYKKSINKHTMHAVKPPSFSSLAQPLKFCFSRLFFTDRLLTWERMIWKVGSGIKKKLIFYSFEGPP